MTTIFTLTSKGYVFTYRIPETLSFAQLAERLGPELSASVRFSTDAGLAYDPASVVADPPKGTDADARAASVRRMTDAPLASVPIGRGPKALTREERIEVCQEEIKNLTDLKVKLMPHRDAYEATIKDARAGLAASFKQHPIFGALPDVTAYRTKRYDDLLQASIKWGKDARDYVTTSRLIDLMADQLRELMSPARRAKA